MKLITDEFKPVSRPEKILQYGEGNFLRAFVDWMVDIANEKTGFNGSAVLVQPIDKGLAEMINGQKGMYTTILRGVQEGKTVEEIRRITSVSRCINPYSQFDDYAACAANPDLRFIISNTTEAGISYSPGETLDAKPQGAFPAKVCAFLHKRWQNFKGDSSKGLVFIPCELIDKNGDKLKEIVLRYADEWNLEKDFISWVNNACDFCNSLVDRIVTGYPRDEADTLTEKIGYRDDLLDTAEIFHLWVIECRKDYSKELPLEEAGLNVIWTDDMSFYRTRKVRILNGAHTMTVPGAFLYGLDTVEECIKDDLIISFMKKGIFGEIIPSMDGDKEQLEQYARDVLERFANPYIKHMLLSITLNSISKYKTRVLPSLLGYIRKNGSLPKALTFSMAALIAFYQGKNLSNGELTGTRGNETYPIKDDLPILQKFEKLFQDFDRSPENMEDKCSALVKAVLSAEAWWGEDLTKHAELPGGVAEYFVMIQTSGIKAAIEDVLLES
ncbi:tagaturonate reductase [Breznakiella homolactica]|uniref:Tagaturonate reductase n=1 Tax=Breznakiella homolactica TaxID=2798577 RepID=A0A7T8BD21_9SPIR|nr:tagaturonate reductase [Breznakiella homolactica]QQO10818.1 tagaturonate reductase [Breznakiella homolactica]